jgi:uncharacterized membrane protein YebE (DUF533 family)
VKASVHLVVGSTGEYSDHSQWNVAAYTTREQAEEHVRRLNEMVAATKADGGMDWDGRGAVAERVRKTLDPDCDIDYTGVEYEIQEVPLARHLDEWLEEYAPPTAHG